MGLRYKVVLAYGVTTCLWAALMFFYAQRGIRTQVSIVVRDEALVDARVVGSTLFGPHFALPSTTGGASPAQALDAPRPAPSPADLQSRVREMGLQLGRRITVIGKTGAVLADSTHSPADLGSQKDCPEVIQARRRGWGADVRLSDSGEGDTLYAALADGRRETEIRVAVPLDFISAFAAGLRAELFKAVVLASVWVLVVTVWLAHGLTLSLGRLADVAERIGSGDLSARARVAGGYEVASLGQTINQMAENLQRAIAELGRTSSQLQAILSHMADGLVAVDADGKVILLNPAAGQLLDVRPHEAIGRPLSDLTTNDDLLETVRRTIELGIVVNDEFAFGPGDERIINASAAPVQTSQVGGPGAVLVLRDRTQARRLERLQQEFVSNASHELRSPVTAIRSLAEALELGALQDPEAGPRFLHEIVAKSEYLGTIVDDIMRLARLEALDQPPLFIRASAIARDSVEALRSQAEQMGVTLEADAPEDVTAVGAVENLEVALRNLIENALKYAAEGGAVQVQVQQRPGHVRVAVVDHGPGIGEEDKERVFERFYRVDKARSRDMGGSGLGLSIVRQAIENIGGQVWLEDTPGGGATFVIWLAAPPPDGPPTESD